MDSKLASSSHRKQLQLVFLRDESDSRYLRMSFCVPDENSVCVVITPSRVPRFCSDSDSCFHIWCSEQYLSFTGYS